MSTGIFPPLSPGSEHTIELPGLAVTKIVVDEKMHNNCYLLRCTSTGAQALIDAADDAERLLRIIGPQLVTAVITTHSHWDHHRALATVVDETAAVTVAGAPDAQEITNQTGVKVDLEVNDGDIVSVGAARLGVIRLTGHTPGSIALVYEPEGVPAHIFTGDSLFPGGVGNTFGDKDAFATLIDDVEAKVFDEFDDACVFHPGHGDDSTLGAERPHLPQWRERGWGPPGP